MASFVTDITHAYPGAEGTYKSSGREYTAHYNIQTDGYQYQGQDIADYCRDNLDYDGSGGRVYLPHDGRYLRYGRTVDREVICDTLTPRLKDGSSTLWTLEAHFKSAKEEEEETNENEAGEATNDPTEWAPTLEISFVEEVVPANKATYRFGFKHQTEGTIYMPDEDDVPIVNSADVMFDPPPEKRVSRMLLRFMSYEKKCPPKLDWAPGSVNSKFVTFKIRDKQAANGTIYKESFQEYELQIGGVSGSIVRKNGRTVWQISTDVLVMDDAWIKRGEETEWTGWRAAVLDRGTYTYAGSGAPDGKGGSLAAPMSGAPAVRAMQDANGNQITKPVFLDGKGQPNPPSAQKVYLCYSIYPERDFKKLFKWLPIP